MLIKHSDVSLDQRYTKTLCTWFLPAIDKMSCANLIKGCSRFSWFKLYYKFKLSALSRCQKDLQDFLQDFLLWVSVKNGFTNIMYPIYLIHIKFDTDFITTLFNFICNTNIIIFIILNTMDRYTRTTTILLIAITFYFKPVKCIILYCNLDWSCIVFAVCSSNFSSNPFTIFSGMLLNVFLGIRL